MASRAKQVEMTGPGFEQETIPAIEEKAREYDEKRFLVKGLKGEMKNISFKLRELAHENEGKLDKQKTKGGEDILVYKRSGVRVAVKYGEEVQVNVDTDAKATTP